ncbi:MAG: hypothetical protein RL320_570 [Pseudomonadota bacterium]|jgi:uncharacterized protein (TIGR02466 family)
MNPSLQAAQHETMKLWACPVGVHVFEQASEFNPLLTRVLKSMRALDPQADQSAPFYASNDDLLTRIRIPEWQKWVEFLVNSIGLTAREANAGTWPADSEDLAVQIRGLWCQISSDGVHHDIHSHGNCSWSGVYVVQVDPDTERESHRVYGKRNGVTRFYGPYFDRLAGASMDYGNAYLQQSHLDFAPQEGRLIIFPSWLNHQAMPYQGSKDRIILSFNASIHRSGGDQWANYAAS